MCMAWRFHFPIRNYDFNRSEKEFPANTNLVNLDVVSTEDVAVSCNICTQQLN